MIIDNFIPSIPLHVVFSFPQSGYLHFLLSSSSRTGMLKVPSPSSALQRRSLSSEQSPGPNQSHRQTALYLPQYHRWTTGQFRISTVQGFNFGSCDYSERYAILKDTLRLTPLHLLVNITSFSISEVGVDDGLGRNI